MIRIGLTGGIGSGKTTVCNLFSELGVPVIDADMIARSVVAPGRPALQQLVSHFGAQILQPDGTLDRKQMRELVFSVEHNRVLIEELLHPLIREEMLRQIDTIESPYVIIAIPLLLEKGWQEELDRVLVVDCDETTQRERASRRDGSTPQLISSIIAHQVSRKTRLAAADDIIDNSGSIEALHAQVESLHSLYLNLALNN